MRAPQYPHHSSLPPPCGSKTQTSVRHSRTSLISRVCIFAAAARLRRTVADVALKLPLIATCNRLEVALPPSFLYWRHPFSISVVWPWTSTRGRGGWSIILTVVQYLWRLMSPCMCVLWKHQFKKNVILINIEQEFLEYSLWIRRQTFYKITNWKLSESRSWITLVRQKKSLKAWKKRQGPTNRRWHGTIKTP